MAPEDPSDSKGREPGQGSPGHQRMQAHGSVHPSNMSMQKVRWA